MPPRFTLGVWWSRYWPYTAEDLTEIARGYATHAIPLDVLVSDMAWHYHGEEEVEWGGYSWGEQLFPRPAHFLNAVDRAGLNLTLNLHLNPVSPDEPSYAAFLHALGLPAATNATIPSAASPPYDSGSVYEELVRSPTFAAAYLALLDTMGTNFWWLDDEPHWVARLLHVTSLGGPPLARDLIGWPASCT
jgi:alpha-glucosidase